MASNDPKLEEMSEVACRRYLSQHQVGRIAIMVDDHPEIFPVNYRFTDGSIVIRVGPGLKLNAIANNPLVAFEIDGTNEERHNGWSVLVVGRTEEVTDPDERVRLMEQGDPAPWPGGEKDHVVLIHAEQVSGRYLLQHRT